MKKGEKYTIRLTGNHTKIHINDLIHLQFRSDEFVGFQSTIEGTNWYTIVTYLKCGQKIKTEYDSRERWEEILKLLDSVKLG